MGDDKKNYWDCGCEYDHHEESSCGCMHEEKEMKCKHMPEKKMHMYGESLRDRLHRFYGDEVLVNVDAMLCTKCEGSCICGRLSMVCSDFIVVDVNLGGRVAPLHIPLMAIRFIAPFDCEAYGAFSTKFKRN